MPTISNNVTLEGERILLRSITPMDATDTYVSWLNDNETKQYLESRFTTHTKEGVRKYIEDTLSSGSNLFLAIIEKETTKHIGNIKLGPVDWNHGVGDIGLIIGDKNSWGKGCATEAIGLITDYAFKELALRKVTAGAYENNIGSIKAFLKQGFIEEGRKKKHFMHQDTPVDHVLLAKFNQNS